MINEREPFDFFVTHVEANGPFLKIFAQTDEQVVQSVNTMLRNIHSKLEYSRPNCCPSNSNFGPNSRCCARRSNNDPFFSRAKILSLRSDGVARLYFVDYGTISYAPVNLVRLIDGSIPETNYLFSMPEAATAFVLADVAPIGGYWQDDVVNKIRTILLNNKYQGVYQNHGDLKVLRFNFGIQDFSKVLLNKNMCLYSPTIQNPPAPEQIYTQVARGLLTTPASAVTVAPQTNWRAPPPVQNSSAQAQKIVKTNSFKAIQLEINSVHDVIVSYVEEGPCKFSVQLVESIPYLNAMMDQINSRSHQPLQEPPIAGAVCLGKQTSTNRLCRVVLNSPGDTSCKVYFADYGHHEVLPFASIYQIPDEFVVPDVFSIRFTLSGIRDWDVSQDMKDYFGGLVNDVKCKLRVCKGPMSPLTQYCDLYVPAGSVKDLLYKAFPDCKLSYIEPERLPKGSTETVYVSHVLYPSKFFVQLEKYAKYLDEISECVEKSARTAENVTQSQLYKGMPCMALYGEDRRWYRASVVDLYDDKRVLVYYVDFGNQDVVSMSGLRSIPGDLVKRLPKQAIACSIHGIPSESKDNELARNFKALVLDEHFSMTVQDILPDCYLVQLNDKRHPRGIDIIEKLKEFKATARKDTASGFDGYSGSNQQAAIKPQSRNEKCDVKNQVPLVQRPKVKSKNVKSGDNLNSSWGQVKPQDLPGDNLNSSWGQVKPQDLPPGESRNANNYDSGKSKFRKDNENEQRHDNRLRKPGPGVPNKDYSGRPQGFGKSEFQAAAVDDVPQGSRDYGANDRFGKNNNYNNGRGNMNARSDRTPIVSPDKNGSDKDSDTSSRTSGSRRNGRTPTKRGTEEPRKRTTPEKQPNSRQRIGKWENEEHAAGSRRQSNDEVASQESSKSSSSATSSRSAPVTRIPRPNITAGAEKNCELVYYNDPTSFYVQLVPDNEELHEMINKIQAIYKNNVKTLHASKIQANLQCVAQYSKDKLWYRAVVKSVESADAAKVHFVDYGNIETVKFDKIKEIETEFLKLPAQAIHCKLFCPPKNNWTSGESDAVLDKLDDKLLEAEFVIYNEGVYEILVKESKSDQKRPSNGRYMNELFSGDFDLMRAREVARTDRAKNLQIPTNEQLASPQYADPTTEKWLDHEISLGLNYEVLVVWFINPQKFYCQLQSQQKPFRAMMNEIQRFYANKQPVSQPLQVGSPVIAVLPEDGVLYRAEILELNKSRGHVVQYIDYGNSEMVDPRKIYPVDQKFRALPKQAIFCGLKNIAPPAGSDWSRDSAETKKFFDSDKLECIIHESEQDKYLVSLKANNIDVASTLVERNLATFSSAPTSSDVANVVADDLAKGKQELPRIDINLLEGQTLYVIVSSVEGVSKFYVQFYTAETCQSIVDTFMDGNDPKVMPGFLNHEICIGAGCLVYCSKKWRRGVVIKCSKPNYQVRIIDTGEHQKFTLNSMLKLPGPLAMMQNQATECALFDVPLSSKADDLLKKTITGKAVKIFVEKVECNRLVVRLFDLDGNKIKVVDSQNTEKISPVCSMQMLSSSHDVVVTCINNSSSVWLQRTAESSTEKQLLHALYDHYNGSEQTEKLTIEANELYAALSYDGNWYRVKVLKLKETEECATVLLIDYGNVEDVRFDVFRKLDSRFYLPHQLAIEVSLTVKVKGDDAEQIKILEPVLAAEKTFSAKFYNVHRKWMAELSEDGEKVSEKLTALNVVVDGQQATKVTHAKQQQQQPQSQQTTAGVMRVGERYKIYFSHVNSPSELWFHRAEDIDALDELHMQLDKMPEVMAKDSTRTGPIDPKPGDLCLALYTFDKRWYRAEVIDFDPKTKMTSVRFIDYGNTDSVDNDPSQLLPIPESLRAIKRFANKCRLDVLPIDDCGGGDDDFDDWSEIACKKTSELLMDDKVDEPLDMLLIADKAPMRVDVFLPGERSVCDALIEAKLAAPTGSGGSSQATGTTDASEPNHEGATAKPTAEKESEGKEAEDEEEEEQHLDPRSAFVSSITSVDEFYVHEEKYVKDLEMIEDRLMVGAMLEQLPKVEEGLMCVAKFSVDGLYYRATILSLNEAGAGTARVRFIDYGNTSVSDDLRVIPKDLADPPPLTRKCRLAKPDGLDEWPTNVNREFIKLSGSGEAIFLLDVIEEGETSLVKLTHESKDLALELLELCSAATALTQEGDNAAAEAAERPSPIGEETRAVPDVDSADDDSCIITQVNSPSEFWIRTKKQSSQLKDVIAKLANASSFDVATKIEEGDVLAAKFHEDDSWYRSKVLSHGERGTEVLYIDHGDTALTESQSTLLRVLPADLKQLPPLATCCSLKLPDNFENWPEPACEKFVELSSNKDAKFRCRRAVSQDLESPVEVTLFMNDRDIVEILLSAEVLKDGHKEEPMDRGSAASADDTIDSNQNSKDTNVSSDSAIHSEVDPHNINVSSTSSSDQNSKDSSNKNTSGDSALHSADNATENATIDYEKTVIQISEEQMSLENEKSLTNGIDNLSIKVELEETYVELTSIDNIHDECLNASDDKSEILQKGVSEDCQNLSTADCIDDTVLTNRASSPTLESSVKMLSSQLSSDESHATASNRDSNIPQSTEILDKDK